MSANGDGRRIGLIVLGASFVGHAGNYLYYVIAARMVSPPTFAAISALIAFGTIAMMPINGIQLAVARDVAVLRTSGTAGALSAYLRRLGRRMWVTCLGLFVLISALSPVLADRLHIGSAFPVILAAVWIATSALLIVLTGVTQGMERFGYVSFALAGPLGMVRALVLPLCLLAAGLAGSMWAMIVATLLGLVVMIRPAVQDARITPAAAPPMPSMLVTIVALLAFSALINLDLLVAQATLAPADRAHYAGAALLGKIAFYAPAALALVLLPRASAALERGERAESAVLKTIALTAGCGFAVAAVLWAMPTSVLTTTFGPAYAAAKPLLAPLALVMTAAAVLWVHLTFATAKRSRRMTVGLVSTAVAHGLLLAFLHGSPQQIILASAIALWGSLVVIELGSGSGIVRMMLARAPKAMVSH
jgi:O-antigen/teichoic acid export membrane protein